MKRIPLFLLPIFFLAGFVQAGQIVIPESGASLLNPRVQSFLKTQGARYGLFATDEGKLLYRKPDLNGRAQEQALNPVTAKRLLALIAGTKPEETEAAMARALESYLGSRLGTLDATLKSRLFTVGPDGKKRLSQTGRNILMDILTAEDGLQFSLPTEGSVGDKKEKKVRAIEALRAMEKAGILITKHLTGGGFESAAQAGAAFDGAVTQNTYNLESYDWNKKGDPVLIRKTRQTNGLYLVSRASPGEEKKSEHLRVLIAAKSPVAIDRLVIREAGSDGAIYSEAGLDAALMKKHGAKVVRAVDNLIAVDVPLNEAAALGNALSRQGIASRPARLFQMVADTVRRGPSWFDPLYSILPFADTGRWAAGKAPSATKKEGTIRPAPLMSRDPGSEIIRPLNEASGKVIKVGGLASKGMDGKGTITAIIDSGLDITHPDFEDRVAAYIDLTDSGTKDFVGHGTHVAGSVGGSGAASGGKYKGMAPGTKFVILKVFGSEGSTSEDTILAAMKAAKSLPKEIQPQVVNMSLGGPGDPDTDPLSAMSNEMMVKDNILMAIAAGNSGPSKYTIGAPGNARYVLTVTGVNKQGKFPFFPSRGPVKDSQGKIFNKPDISTVAGDVSATQRLRYFVRKFLPSSKKGGVSAAADEEPSDPGCYYAPGGVISSKSKDDQDTQCSLKGNPQYRYMTGTSMATPLAAGIAADVVGYMKSKDQPYKASEIKALLMETADDLKEKPEVQGAGLVNGDRIAKVLEERVKMGLPVGNVAFSIAHHASKWENFNMRLTSRFEKTSLGILDKNTGHLIHNDTEFDALLQKIGKDYKALPLYSRAWRKIMFWFDK